MGQGAVFKDGHDGGNRHTIVCAKGRSRGLHPFTLNASDDGVSLEVVCRLGRLLRHHVHVSLQRDAFAIFVAGSSGLIHQDVSGLVLPGFNAAFGCPFEEEALHFLQMSARTRYLGEEVEVVPNGLGFKM